MRRGHCLLLSAYFSKDSAIAQIACNTFCRHRHLPLLAFINRLDPTPSHCCSCSHSQSQSLFSSLLLLITATSQSRRKQETLRRISRQSRVESCESRVETLFSGATRNTSISASHLYEELNGRRRRQRRRRQVRQLVVAGGETPSLFLIVRLACLLFSFRFAAFLAVSPCLSLYRPVCLCVSLCMSFFFVVLCLIVFFVRRFLVCHCILLCAGRVMKIIAVKRISKRIFEPRFAADASEGTPLYPAPLLCLLSPLLIAIYLPALSTLKVFSFALNFVYPTGTCCVYAIYTPYPGKCWQNFFYFFLAPYTFPL